MKRNQHHLFLIIILMLITISIVKDLPEQQVKAATTSEVTDKTYLNVISKFLYLGRTGKNKFDFNIKEEALPEGATYNWYIVEDKGNPTAVRIDPVTGIVTAKYVGVAYIGCKITLPDQTVISQEAKVEVINNITEVGISNIPDERTVVVGDTMDFDHKIYNTMAGKDVLTNGIVRWEILEDTAGVGIASEDGAVVPQKIGSFSIRAICFQNIDDYNSWVKNKDTSINKITAASDWVKITSISVIREVSTQKQLNEMLKTEGITQITVNTEVKQELTIPEGNYSDRTLVVDAPNSNVINYGIFKKIIIKSANTTTWKEYAAGNNIEICNSSIYLSVADKASVKSLRFYGEENRTASDTVTPRYKVIEKSDIIDTTTRDYINMINSAEVTNIGKIELINIAAATKLILTGSGTVNNLKIEESADGTMVATYLACDFVSDADVIMSILDGGEAIKVKILFGAYAKIENLTRSNIGVYYGSDYYNLSISGQPMQFYSNGKYSFSGLPYTSSIIKLIPVEYSPVTASAIKAGLSLNSSELKGSFYYKGALVEGTLSWLGATTIVKSTGYYQWFFKPTDFEHYDFAFGVAEVKVIE